MSRENTTGALDRATMPEIRRAVARTVRKRVRAPGLGLLVAATVTAAPARADPSVPWSPSLQGRHAIELLVDRAGLGLTTSHWPLPRAAVRRALADLPASLPPALDRARDRVRQELDAAAGPRATVTARNRADALPGFGDDSTPGSSVTVRSDTLATGLVAAQGGARIEAHGDADRHDAQFRLDGSAVALEALGVQLQAWSHRGWWSPGWQTALAFSNNAPAFNAIGLQRAAAGRSDSPWLAWMGPWNVEVFMGRTESDVEPQNPYLLGTRLTLRPFSHLELGFTKMAQWGGDGQPRTWRTLFDAFTGQKGNADTPEAELQDPANTLAGFDARVTCPSGWGCAAYAQLIGEDEANGTPSRLLGSYGLSWATPEGGHRLFLEFAETGCQAPIDQPMIPGCAYRNYAYPQGYVHAMRWLGGSAGPDSRLLTLGWVDAVHRGSLKLHWGRIGARYGTFSPTTTDPVHAGRVVGVSARRAIGAGDLVLTPELDWTRVSAAAGTRQDLRLGVTLDVGLEGAGRHLSGLSAPRRSPLTDALWAAGLIGVSALLDDEVDEHVQRHGDGPSARTVRDVGNAVPFVAAGLAVVTWAGERGTPAGDVGRAASYAALSAAAGSVAIKYVVDRSRPEDNRGPSDFGHADRGKSAFPSTHAAVAWAAITPFAQAYDAPWLYGVAALTNAARVLGRDHWVSDTVAGALLGYGLGDWFNRRGRDVPPEEQTRVWLGDRSVHVNVPFH